MVQDFKEQKLQMHTIRREQEEQQMYEKREEVSKQREIARIIQGEQRGELQKNLNVFLALNKEERMLRRELVEKQVEVEFKEKYIKKMTVLNHHKNQAVKREEQDKFVNAFSQAKNLIEKQMKIGKRIKENKIHSQVNKAKVEKYRQDKGATKSQEKQVLRSVLFDQSQISTQMMSRVQMLDTKSNRLKTTE